jgi:hypothetical protein
MRLRKTGWTAAAVLTLVLGAVAQTAGENAPPAGTNGPREGWGYVLVGLQNVGLSDLNGPMVSQGYSRFGETFFSLGGGGMAIFGRLILGGEGYILFDRTSTRGPVQGRLGAGCGFFDLGYVFWQQDQFRAYALLGLGGGGWTLQLTDSASVPLENVLATPGRASTLTTAGFMACLSVGADWTARLGGGEGGEGAVSFGLRAGYALTPFKSQWKMRDFEITPGTKMGLAGPFVRLVVGFGGRR